MRPREGSAAVWVPPWGPAVQGCGAGGHAVLGTDSGAGVSWRPAKVLSVNRFHTLETFQN